MEGRGQGSDYVCELCGERIVHDAARVDGGRIYHMSCFRRHLGQGREGLRECPACQTLGAQWSLEMAAWEECGACGGTGYVSSRDRFPSSSGTGAEPAAC